MSDEISTQWGIGWYKNGRLQVAPYDDREDAESHLKWFEKGAFVVCRTVQTTPWTMPELVSEG